MDKRRRLQFDLNVGYCLIACHFRISGRSGVNGASIDAIILQHSAQYTEQSSTEDISSMLVSEG